MIWMPRKKLPKEPLQESKKKPDIPRFFYNIEYQQMLVEAPEAPETICFICPALKKMYLNTSAEEHATLVRIVPFTITER